MIAKGWGFLNGSDGQDYIAHHSEILGTGFKTLREGAEVSFIPSEGDRGPLAKNIKVTRS